MEGFRRDWEEEIHQLQSELRQGTYRPQPARRTYIEKLRSAELRPLGIPAVRDRVVQTALRNVMEPILERDFADNSEGFRPGRGCRTALRKVVKSLEEGRTWKVDADPRRYFDTIPHDKLMAAVGRRITDGKVLALIESYLRAGILKRNKGWKATESGTPQGAVLSPLLLANIYLNDLDNIMAAKGRQMIRYADDSVILCRSEEEAREALEEMRQWVEEAGLTLHPEKTRLINANERGGFDFLGYHFERARKGHGFLQEVARKKSVMKLPEVIRKKTTRGRSGPMHQILVMQG